MDSSLSEDILSDTIKELRDYAEISMGQAEAEVPWFPKKLDDINKGK